MGFVSLSDDLDNETQLSSQWLRYLSQEILPLSYLIRICRQWCGCDITHSPNIPNIAQWMYFFFFFFCLHVQQNPSTGRPVHTETKTVRLRIGC